MTPTKLPRWAALALAAALPVLVVAGVAGAAVASRDNSGAGDTLVAAARDHGSGNETVSEVPAAVAIPTTTTPAPPPTGPATTVPVAVPVAVPTTAATATATVPPTVPTTAPAPAPTAATVTIVNQHSAGVQLTVNGATFMLAPGQVVPDVQVVPAPSGNDLIELRLSDALPCGVGDAMGYFTAGGRFRLTVVTAPGICDINNTPQANFKVTPA